MDKESKGFTYLRQKFHKISETKMNEGIFFGPQIKQLFEDQDFSKVKVIPQQAKVALGVPGRLRPRIISTFSTTRVVDHQPYTLAASTPREIPGTHFQRLS